MAVPDTRTDLRVERSRAQLRRGRCAPCSQTQRPPGHLGLRAVRRGRGQPADLLPALREPRRGRRRRRRGALPPAARRASRCDGPDASALLLVRFLEELDGERPAWQRTIGSGTAFSASRDAVESGSSSASPSGRRKRARRCSATPRPASWGRSGPGCCRPTGPTGRARPSSLRAWSRCPPGCCPRPNPARRDRQARSIHRDGGHGGDEIGGGHGAGAGSDRVRAGDQRRPRHRAAGAARRGGPADRRRAQPAADDEAAAGQPGVPRRHQRPARRARLHPGRARPRCGSAR